MNGQRSSESGNTHRQVYKYFKIGRKRHTVLVRECVNYISKDLNGEAWGMGKDLRLIGARTIAFGLSARMRPEMTLSFLG